MALISRPRSSASKASARVRVRLRLVLCISCTLLAVIVLACWILPSEREYSIKQSTEKSLSFMHGHHMPALRAARYNEDRIAIILPFVGQSTNYNRYTAPAYLAMFCAGAIGAAEVADFFIFHNGVLDAASLWDCPNNVKFVDLGSSENFARHLLRVLDQKDDASLEFESRDKLIQLVAKHLYVYPYCLVEFKPALGHIFADFIAGYSHWGYSDLDMLYGDLGRWITPDELKDFDIVTYSFGDQHRLYLRGQLTFHKNTPKITQLWRSCDYLSHLDARLANVVNRKTKYHFESAEGCYSAAILQQNNIRVKYASKAWTDVHGKDTAYSHGVYLARDLRKSRHVIYKASSQATGNVLDHLSSEWFNEDKVYRDRTKHLQQASGDMELLVVPSNDESKCMYWVQQKYQSTLCLDEKDAGKNDTVYWIDGQLYKQRHIDIALETDVNTAPFFHFQEWKRFYRSTQIASLHASSPISHFVLTKEGAIALAPSTTNRWSVFSNGLASPLQIHMNHWNTIDGDRNTLPSQTYCLVSGRRKVPPQPPTSDCYFATSWRDIERVRVISQAPQWAGVTINADVTLVLTLQITKAQATHRQSLVDIVDLAANNLDRWQGQPAVLVFHVSGSNDQVSSLLDNRFGPQSDLEYGTNNALIAVISQEEDVLVSRKALLNMAIDGVPTRWYISGIELERGILLSADAVYVAQRVVVAQGVEGGRLYIIPQFALNGDTRSLSLSELRGAWLDGRLQSVSFFDEVCDEDSMHYQLDFDKLWWSRTDELLHLRQSNSANATSSQKFILDLLELELSIMEFLTDDGHMAMFALDESPILLTDNLSPRIGLRTDEVVRHAEELGGRRCYNGLRLAQFAALHYQFYILGGVFGMSTKETRSIARWGHDHSFVGLSRCDGCFMFTDEDHEIVLEGIVADEVIRPAKTAIIWSERS
ncbi:hypothetical protein MPSEU_000096400 [Mayamaea pseudoterrestris]|nr:hypothetical protein MPSEU_000096400 [Mayamaea pseudoterrestris]